MFLGENSCDSDGFLFTNVAVFLGVRGIVPKCLYFKKFEVSEILHKLIERWHQS